MTRLRISVVIPAFNIEHLLGTAISSALAQDVSLHEVIVVDDGSDDGTAAVASAFREVRLIRQSNRGLSAARNAGVAAATGDAVFFLDADDELLLGALGVLTAEASALEGRWGAIVPNCIKVGGNGEVMAWPQKPERRTLNRDAVRDILCANWLIPHHLAPIDVCRSYRYDERLPAAEDLARWLEMLLSGEQILVLGRPLIRYRVGRPGALSSQTRRMRVGRRRVFYRLVRHPKLIPTERALAGYQLARSSIGALAAPRSPTLAGPPSSGSVLHVYLDEPGGGPAHVGLLLSSIGSHLNSSELGLASAQLGNTSLAWPRSIALLWRSIGSGKPFVHAHGVRAAAACMIPARLRGAPVVVTIHGLHSLRGSHSRLSRILTRLVLRRASAVLVFGESDRRSLVEGDIVRESRIRTIHAGFTPPVAAEKEGSRQELGLPAQDVVLLWLGRMRDEKDPLAFVEAFSRTKGSLVAIMAGDGELTSQVKRAVDATCPDRIRLPGWIDAGVALGASDIYVNTSRWEGLSLAALEAASVGLPLILTDVPGNRDLVEAGVPAVLVPQGDPDRLAAALHELAADPDRRREMGAEASRVVRSTFTPEALAEDVLRVYAELS